MAKDNREIRRGIRTAGTNRRVFLPEQEDELQEVLTKDQVTRLTESDAIRGDFEAKGKPAPKADKPATDKP
jgi:ribosomal protein L19E